MSSIGKSSNTVKTLTIPIPSHRGPQHFPIYDHLIFLHFFFALLLKYVKKCVQTFDVVHITTNVIWLLVV